MAILPFGNMLGGDYFYNNIKMKAVSVSCSETAVVMFCYVLRQVITDIILQIEVWRSFSAVLPEFFHRSIEFVLQMSVRS